MKTNVFYHGDCLFVMKHDIPDESIDLIYLDPPFFTGKVQKPKNHDRVCREHGWDPGAMQISYDDSKKFWKEKGIHERAPEWLKHIALQRPDFASYLYYMMERLQECHRILKPTGSIYLHCDWRASHYLKMIMDEVFGYKNFRNEIIWRYRRWTAPSKKFQNMHDTILFYSRSDSYVFNKLKLEVSDELKKRKKKGWSTNTITTKRGTTQHKIRQLLIYDKDVFEKAVKSSRIDLTKYDKVVDATQMKVYMPDVWDIPFINSMAEERVGYPTQKPIELLKCIILASSNPKDVVLDPFCGCGTTVVAAHELDREWIGIDINNVAIEVIKKRCSQLKLDKPLKYSIIERTIEGVKKMIETAKPKSKGHVFESWVNEFFNAEKPVDKGVDGITPDGIPIQVKTYKINDTIVNGFYGHVLWHHDVPKPLKTIRLVSGEGYTESARQAKFEIESKEGVKVELLTLEDLLK